MPITLKKPRVATQVETEFSPVSDLIERVGELAPEAEKIMAKIKKLDVELKPYKAALKELVTAISALPHDPDLVGSEISPNFVAEFGKASNKRDIKDLAKAREFLGDELFMTLASVKLGDLDAYLTPPQLKEVLEESHGDRKVTVKPRQP